jgi:acyl-coenzyme A synthetase/AMP-(fatty) acid ligase
VAAFVDEIPRNPSGKILKRVLRERFAGVLRAPE